MVTRIEPRVPLVNDEEELAEVTAYDTTSICTMDVVEEHRYRPTSMFADSPAPPPVRPRSPSVYSMFVTDHSHSSRPRCKNPSVYSMPIAAFRRRDVDDDNEMDDLGHACNLSGSSDDDRSDDENDEHSDDQVFMTKRSRRLSQNRNTDTHSHMNFRPRCKNPSVYSMPILGASQKEAVASNRMRTLQVAPLVPLPFATEEAQSAEKSEHFANDETYDAAMATGAHGHGHNGNTAQRPRIQRVASRRVQPTVRDNIATGFTSCRGRPNDDSLPPSYHITICVGIFGVVFFFGGIAMSIVGFNTKDTGEADSSKALRVLGPIMLCSGFFMCIGCFIYLCVVYLRYKRLSAYLKRRNSARQMRVAPPQPTEAPQQNGVDQNRVRRFHHTPEAAAEDIRQMLQTLQTGGEITRTNSLQQVDNISQSGDTPL